MSSGPVGPRRACSPRGGPAEIVEKLQAGAATSTFGRSTWTWRASNDVPDEEPFGPGDDRRTQAVQEVTVGSGSGGARSVWRGHGMIATFVCTAGTETCAEGAASLPADTGRGACRSLRRG